MKGLTRRQASSDATRPARQNLVERRFQIGQHAIGGRAPPPHGIGILAVEGGEVWLGASTGAPPPRPLGNSPMPVGESLGGELADFEFAKRPENVLPRHAFDAVGGLAAAAPIILEIIRHRPGYGIGFSGRQRAETASEPLLLQAPGARRTLRLRKVDRAVAVGVLEIIGQAELGPRDRRRARRGGARSRCRRSRAGDSRDAIPAR